MPALATTDVDLLCYMVDSAGRVINLHALCVPNSRAAFSNRQVQASRDSSTSAFAGTQCSDFATWGEAQFHLLAGSAPASLDGDGDRVACEALPRTPRTDGNAVFTNQSNRGDWVINIQEWRVNATDYYLKVSVPQEGLEFTTQSFASSAAARAHMRAYYGSILN